VSTVGLNEATICHVRFTVTPYTTVDTTVCATDMPYAVYTNRELGGYTVWAVIMVLPVGSDSLKYLR